MRHDQADEADVAGYRDRGTDAGGNADHQQQAHARDVEAHRYRRFLAERKRVQEATAIEHPEDDFLHRVRAFCEIQRQRDQRAADRVDRDTGED